MFNSNQKEMYKIYKEAGDNSILVWLLSRQSGKSFGMGIIATMTCMEKSNVIVKLLTDTKLHCRTVYEPIFRQIFEKFPEDLRPEYISSQYVYIFKNGSQIQMAGSDGNSAERLRGQASDLVLIDEAAFCTNLDYNVMSILLPTCTHSGGKIILASTPPDDPTHDFVHYIEKAEKEGRLTKKTIYDNQMLTKEQVDNLISKFPGGVNNHQFRREYLCELIKDEELSVIPEITEELLNDIVKEHPLPPYFNRYVAMDIGFRDFTVVLFGYYDFRADKIIIQDEICKNGLEIHLPVFTKEIMDKESDLWLNVLTNELIKPDVRVSDINPFVLQELAIESKKIDNNRKLSFIIADKDNKLANINKLRVLLANKKIIISPKCVNLIRHLKHCRWKDKTSKDEFAKSPDNGHYDAVDALLYFTRAINYNKNPYPSTYGYNIRDLHVENRNNFEKQSAKQVYETIFNVGNKKSKAR